MKTIGYKLEEDMNEIKYISNTLTLLAMGLNPDNELGIISNEIVLNVVQRISYKLDDIHKHMWDIIDEHDEEIRRVTLL